ncbi:hypothetical protein [Flavobacterium sp.]|uniref:hypothetical protein n=1 Tax=Flavobacterium sp. TaxID=239 RepID=UPI002B4B811C|nr:hypothetical protein [Flavobacterium sp.]HLF53032.1 hypothetical protein [Flavobacterium sp.]
MTKLFYFKITFLSLTAGIFAGSFVYGLFGIDFTKTDLLFKLFLKSLIIGITVGLILGVLNMFFKIGNFQKKENS